MKLSILMALSIIAFASTGAQEKSRFEENRSWSILYYMINPIDKSQSTTTYIVKGDTVINEKRYKTFYYSRNEELSDYHPLEGEYIREDSNKIFKVQD